MNSFDFHILKITALLISLLIFNIASIVKKLNNGIHTPGTIYALFWFYITFFPSIILYQIPISPISIFYIFLSVLLFNLPSIFFDWKLAKVKVEMNKEYILSSLDSNFFKLVFVISFIASIFFLMIMLLQNGFNITYFFIDFLSTSTQFANNRTLYDYQYGIIGQLTTLFPFIVVLMGSFISSNIMNKTKRFIWIVLSMLPVTISMLLQSSKILFLYGIFFFISVKILLKIYTGGIELFNKKSISNILYFTIFLVPVLIIAFKSREGYNDLSIIEMAPTIFSYFFGSIFAFSDYFVSRLGLVSISSYYHDPQLAFGYYSFKPLFELFGGNKFFPIGFYEDFYSYNDIIKSNIFTYYRQLIQDFGIIGSLIFILFMGFLLHFFYFQMLVRKAPFFYITTFIVFLVFLGISYLMNAFTARTVLVVGTTLYFILKINNKLYKNKFNAKQL